MLPYFLNFEICFQTDQDGNINAVIGDAIRDVILMMALLPIVEVVETE
jgi:hypothetical protein